MSKTLEAMKTERCYRCGGELEDGFVTVPSNDYDAETGYRGDEDFACSRCAVRDGLILELGPLDLIEMDGGR